MNVLEVKSQLAPWLDPDDKKILCVEFYSLTSDDCKEIARPYSILARNEKEIVCLRLNIDRLTSEQEIYHIESVPTFILYYCGKEEERIISPSISILEEKINNLRNKIKERNMVNEDDNPNSQDSIEILDNTSDSSYDMTSSDFNSSNYSSQESPVSFGNGMQAHRLGSAPPSSIKSENEISPVNKPKEDNQYSYRNRLLEIGFDVEIVDQLLLSNPHLDFESLVSLAIDMQNEKKSNNTPSSMWDFAEQQLMKTKLKKITQVHETRQDYERKVHIQEIEKKRLKKLEAEEDKKRLLAQFRDDHNFVIQKSVRETTKIEKIVILIDSIFSQRQYSIGKNALRTIEKVLQNTANTDPKYRRIRKDNPLLNQKIAVATGGIALLQMAGFELKDDVYIMEERDDELVNGIINTINKRINPFQ